MRYLNTAMVSPVILAAVLYVQREQPVRSFSHQEILDAMWQVEASGRLNPPDGDGGMSIGPLQIQESYFMESRVQGDYQDCRKLDFARRVVAGYMQRWVPEAWEDRDAETIARVHNGGPRGAERESTLPYWRRVQLQLAKLR